MEKDGYITALFVWLSGWRIDLDGWWVRAKREHDPKRLPSDVGFVEEAAIVVRSRGQARAIDKGWRP